MSDPIRVALWEPKGDGAYGWVTDVETWEEITLEPRYNGVGTWSLTMPWDDKAAQVGKRSLITFDFRGIRVTGLLDSFGPQADDKGRPILKAEACSDAFALLGDARCWPDPASPIQEQDVVSYVRKGPAETVVRNLIQDNLVDRLGYDIHVPASQGRGATVGVNLQFNPLLDMVVAKAEAGGIGVRVGLVNLTPLTARLEVQFFEPFDLTGPAGVLLSHETGGLRTWSQNDVAPTGTRAIVFASQDETVLTIGSVNVTNNTLTITGSDKARHHLATGSVIRFSGRGVPPAPLEDRRRYFAIRVDQNTFKVATTRRRAAAGTEVNLTDVGTDPIRVTETTRVFRYVTRPAVENEWGRKRELLTKTGIEDADDDEDPYVEQANEALRDAAAQSSFELQTVEPEGTRLGEHLNLGDTVTVRLATGTERDDRVRAARISMTGSEGLRVELTVGNPDSGNPMFRQAAITRGLRHEVDAMKREES